MSIHLTARHMDLTPEIRQACDKRLKGLEKSMGPGLDLDILVLAEKRRFRVELHAVGRGLNVVVEEESAEVGGALKKAFDGLEKKLKKEKEKLLEKKRRGGRERRAGIPVEEDVEPRRKLVASQDFSLKPMSVEEALIHLDLKKREVFMFRKLGTERWALVYRRRDGHIGLVEPE